MRATALMLAVCGAGVAHAEPLILEGELLEEGGDYAAVPFEVPAGVVEVEVRHPRLQQRNILDYGLSDPLGFRGWGGGNPEPIVVGEQAASRSYLAGPIVAGTWTVSIGKAQLGELPARYRLEIELRATATLPAQPERSPYAPVVLSQEARWYAGDLHVHSEQSGDGQATFEQIALLAESRGLDFVELSDHNTIAQLDFYAAAQARHPRLLFLPGVELTTYAGHANGIGATRWIDHKIGAGGVEIGGVARAVAEQGGVFSLNHPVLDLGDACIGCAWRHPLPYADIGAVEIGTGGWKEGAYLFGERAIAYWDAICEAGAHAAAVGGSDDHTAGLGDGPFKSDIGSPTTLVYAEELSARAIAEGIRRGRTVVKLEGPSDPMIELSASVEPDWPVVQAAELVLSAKVSGGMGQELRWYADGQQIAAAAIDTNPFVHRFTPRAPDVGETRFRAEVWVEGAPRTVTSHLYLRAPEGCGCESSGGQRRGGLGLWVLLAVVGGVRIRSGSRMMRA